MFASTSVFNKSCWCCNSVNFSFVSASVITRFPLILQNESSPDSLPGLSQEPTERKTDKTALRSTALLNKAEPDPKATGIFRNLYGLAFASFWNSPGDSRERNTKFKGI